MTVYLLNGEVDEYGTYDEARVEDGVLQVRSSKDGRLLASYPLTSVAKWTER